MMGIDCINQQAVSDRDCSHCIWHTSGQCANWNCEPVSRKDALEALEKVKAMESAQSTHSNTPNTLETLDCISRQDTIDALWGEREKLDSYMDECLKKGLFALRSGTKAEKNRIEEDIEIIRHLPSAQPETARRIVGKSRDGMTLWYQCDMCNEPVDKQDVYCRGCGRRFVDE